MAAPVAKRMCNSIGTHNGTFHCDEALACALLRMLPQFAQARVVRTRDPAVLADCTLVADVGGTYNADTLRFDHHQRGFSETMRTITGQPFNTKLSSAGLVYAHYGREVIAQILANLEGASTVADAVVEVLYSKVYEHFVEEIDAVDNGVSRFDTDQTPKYIVSTSLSARVGRLNPAWNSKGGPTPDELFQNAMELTGREFRDRVVNFYESWLPARDIVRGAMLGASSVDASGRIAVLGEGGCPWKSHLFELEEQLSASDYPRKLFYVLYADQSGNWRVQCVPKDPSSFTNRQSLPESWQGVRDDALSKLSGIDGCIFVHASGFIGGNKTKEGALAMARAGVAEASAPAGN